MSAATEIDTVKTGSAPPPKSKLDNLQNFCYNPSSGAVFGRTASSWAKISLFYLIFYSCLAGFFAVMLMLFFETISDTEPRQIGPNSLIKGNPGMGFRPMPKVTSTLVMFDRAKEKSYNQHIANINILIHKYHNETEKFDYEEDCGGNNTCAFDMSVWEEHCNASNQYGFSDGEPCVLLKLNKVYNWEPDLYVGNETEPRTDEQNEFDEYVNAKNPYNEAEQKHVITGYGGAGVPVICEGENYGDKDNIGQVQYFPPDGFQTKYFPFAAQKGYQAPLVMAKFKNVKKHVLMQVWCKAYANNIEHNKNDKGGSIRFELMID